LHTPGVAYKALQSVSKTMALMTIENRRIFVVS